MITNVLSFFQFETAEGAKLFTELGKGKTFVSFCEILCVLCVQGFSRSDSADVIGVLDRDNLAQAKSSPICYVVSTRNNRGQPHRQRGSERI